MVNAKPFRVLIQELHAHGITYRDMGRATGLHYNTIRQVAQRPRRSLHEHTAAELRCLVELLPQENL